MTPDDVARRTFTTVRKGYRPHRGPGLPAVSVATELREARAQVILELDRELRPPGQEAERNRDLDPPADRPAGRGDGPGARRGPSAADEMRAKASVVEPAAERDHRQHRRARSTAESRPAELLAEAEATSTRVRTEAAAEADRLRQEAAGGSTATAEAEARSAEIRPAEGDRGCGNRPPRPRVAAEVETRPPGAGREMVAEAQKVRERMLSDLARRRKAFRQQIERLQAGRDRLMSAYDVVRETLDVATEELQVALPEARLAAEAAVLRAAEEDEPSLEDLEREAASLPRRRPPPEPAERGRTARGRDLDETEPASREEAEEPECAEPEAPMAPSDASVRGAGRRRSRSSATRSRRPSPSAEPEAEVAPAEAVAVSHADLPARPRRRAERAARRRLDRVGRRGEGAEPEAEVSSLFARIREETAIVRHDRGPGRGRGHRHRAGRGDRGRRGRAGRADRPGCRSRGRARSRPSRRPEEPDADHQLVARRDEALVEIERNLGRRIKRELSDEQNELLDTVRRQKGVPTAADGPARPGRAPGPLPHAALPSLVAAATAGADLLVDRASSCPGPPRRGPRSASWPAELASSWWSRCGTASGALLPGGGRGRRGAGRAAAGLLPGVEGPAGRRAGVAPGAGRGQPGPGRPPGRGHAGALGGGRRRDPVARLRRQRPGRRHPQGRAVPDRARHSAHLDHCRCLVAPKQG